MKKLILLFAVFSATFVTGQNIPSYVPTNGLIGWWPFNGNANDESGNGNNGVVNGATLTADRLGNANSAYNFDGVDDYISGTSNNLNVVSTNKLSITSWINVNQFAAAPASSKLVTHTDASDIGQQYALSIGNDGSIYFLAGNGAFENNGFNISPAGQIQNNAWVHVAVVVSIDSVKLYLNGNMIMGKSENDNFPINPIGVFVFSSITNTTYNKLFNGNIDDIGIWNRALLPQEVVDLYSGCQDSILSEPISNTFPIVPGNAHFTTVYSDTSATYQWQQNAGTGWTNLSDFGIYSGTSTDSLVLTGITSSLDGYGYRCLIDACTMDTTDVAYLTVVDNIGLEESATSIIVSPNPTNGFITVDINANYSVFNMSGQKVAEGKTEGKIDLSNLPVGSYKLILDTNEGTTAHTIQKI